jgi:Rrf2 family nitric oxide-sensitive transcriptional repressor
MYLATRQQRATVADVATVFQISGNHVAKVVNLLSRYGYIRSIRGSGGGIELARHPQEITVGEVIERMEGNLHLLSCLGTDDSCCIHPSCKLRGALAEAERLQKEYLNSVTLADVTPVTFKSTQQES